MQIRIWDVMRLEWGGQELLKETWIKVMEKTNKNFLEQSGKEI